MHFKSTPAFAWTVHSWSGASLRLSRHHPMHLAIWLDQRLLLADSTLSCCRLCISPGTLRGRSSATVYQSWATGACRTNAQSGRLLRTHRCDSLGKEASCGYCWRRTPVVDNLIRSFKTGVLQVMTTTERDFCSAIKVNKE